MVDYLMVPNLEKWQHYKDRFPPWIKLHRDLLNDYQFGCLQDASKAHLIAIWLLASQMDNKIPYDSNWISNKINATSKVDIKLLIDNGFIVLVQSASEMLADCKQSAMREREGEREGKGERETQEPSTVVLPSSAKYSYTEVTPNGTHDIDHNENVGLFENAEHPVFDDSENPESPSPKKIKTKKIKPEEPNPATEAWAAYSREYFSRYHTEPVRNAKINAQLRQFVKRVPQNEAALIAAYYLHHENYFYVQKGHSIGLLLADAEKLRTEWATNTKITSGTARQRDRTQTIANAFAPLIAEARKQEAEKNGK